MNASTEPACVSRWPAAMTLLERYISANSRAGTSCDRHDNHEEGRQRVEDWKTQPPFDKDRWFQERLAADGLTGAAFCEIVSEAGASFARRLPDPPQWQRTLAEAYCAARTTATPVFEFADEAAATGFLSLVEPLIEAGCRRLSRGMRGLARRYARAPFDRQTAGNLFLGELANNLVNMLGRTLVLELHVAQLDEQLGGDTPPERFRRFAERIRHREVALEILDEYPVLARQVVSQIDRWVDVSLEFLQRLCADWESVIEELCPDGDPGNLAELTFAGDTHRGGRSVLVVEFDSGFRMVYKPRQLGADIKFQQLLQWLNQRGATPDFRTLSILNRGTHGWVEFVEVAGCSSPEQVHRFYERQGNYLAVLYALAATDVHCENILAAGEHPVLIDSETLFHPVLWSGESGRMFDPADVAMRDSVLSSGLLPHREFDTDDPDGVDLSGLGATEGQVSPFELPRWDSEGTDEMRLVRDRTTIEIGQGRPTLNGRETDVFAYADAISKGFERTYHLLLKHRKELLDDDGPLTAFADEEVRVVVRPTQTYGRLLQESFHPDLLRDALDRDRYFDRLWIQAQQCPSLAKLIAAERNDLLSGDVPIFTTRPSSHDLWTSQNERVGGFLPESGMQCARRRISRLGPDDLIRQQSLLRAALATAATAEDVPAGIPGDPTREPRKPGRDVFLAEAMAVGERLGALALENHHGASWAGLAVASRDRWSLGKLGIDLYDGLPGVVLFLAYLGEVSGEQRHTSLAKAATSTLLRQVQQQRSSMRSLGAFSGWGGVIYTLTHLAALWDDASLLGIADELVTIVPDLVEEDANLDVISGAAGCIPTLLALNHLQPSTAAVEAALRCGQHLLNVARPMENGIGWRTAGFNRPMTGFSHGAAGSAWALLKLWAVTGEPSFRDASTKALDYERSCFSSAEGNWLDVRDLPAGPVPPGRSQPTMVAWCHGAPGIGLGRALSQRHAHDSFADSEIATAFRATLAHGFGGNHSLCHGDLGNLECLFQMSYCLEEPGYKATLRQIAAGILDDIHTSGPRCPLPLGVDSPGLMTGLAGIGYGLLRLAEPERVPSVLALAPPSHSLSADR